MEATEAQQDLVEVQDRGLRLKFDDPFVSLILDELKGVTRRRLGSDSAAKIRIGDVVIFFSEQYPAGFARVICYMTRREPLGVMTDEDAMAEGFITLEGFRRFWSAKYSVFDPSEVVKVIDFQLLADLVQNRAVR